MYRLRRFGRWMVVGVLLGLTACSSNKPPSTVVDACRIRSERPHWYNSMVQTEKKWGVPVSVQMATIARESSFRHDARPMKTVGSWIFARDVPRSSALGFSQALDGTWDMYQQHTGRRRADRTDFADSSDFIGWYMSHNAQLNGVARNDAFNQYLAYHEGFSGYARGTWRRKSWLPAVATDVQRWANRYEVQLASCS